MDPISATLHKTSRRETSPIGVAISDDSDNSCDWKKKLKRPRMSMVADEVQKKPVGNRLMKPLKRRVENNTRYHVAIYISTFKRFEKNIYLLTLNCFPGSRSLRKKKMKQWRRRKI